MPLALGDRAVACPALKSLPTASPLTRAGEPHPRTDIELGRSVVAAALGGGANDTARTPNNHMRCWPWYPAWPIVRRVSAKKEGVSRHAQHSIQRFSPPRPIMAVHAIDRVLDGDQPHHRRVHPAEAAIFGSSHFGSRLRYKDFQGPWRRASSGFRVNLAPYGCLGPPWDLFAFHVAFAWPPPSE